MNRRYRVQPVLTVVLSGLAGLSCGPGGGELPEMVQPPEDYPLAFFHDDCAPWDGPAVSVYLVQEPMTEPWSVPTPHLRMSLYEPVSGLLGRTLDWTTDRSNDAWAARCLQEDACEPAARMRVRLRELEGDGAWLRGDLELTFADGTRETGAFRAVRLDFLAVCG